MMNTMIIIKPFHYTLLANVSFTPLNHILSYIDFTLTASKLEKKLVKC